MFLGVDQTNASVSTWLKLHSRGCNNKKLLSVGDFQPHFSSHCTKITTQWDILLEQSQGQIIFPEAMVSNISYNLILQMCTIYVTPISVQSGFLFLSNSEQWTLPVMCRYIHSII